MDSLKQMINKYWETKPQQEKMQHNQQDLTLNNKGITQQNNHDNNKRNNES